MCRDSNADGLVGGIAEALRGADVCAAFSASGPGIIKPEWVRGMARDAIVFARDAVGLLMREGLIAPAPGP